MELFLTVCGIGILLLITVKLANIEVSDDRDENSYY